MLIRLAGWVNDSIVDGPGLRLAIFAQGCPHHCPGCHNPQSHDFEGGSWVEISALLDVMKENILLDGVTLTGGEPFAQPEPCAEIARAAHAAGLNVWCYSGYTFEALLHGEPAWRELLESIDVLVDGPFLLERRTLEKRFRGSSNQRILDVPESLRRGQAVSAEWN